MSGPFQSWASAEGWGSASAVAPAYYPLDTVDVLAAGGGLIAGGWNNYIVGRAAPGVTRVSAPMVDGATISTDVQHGMYVLDQVTPTQTEFDQQGLIVVLGYNASGRLVYQSRPMKDPADPPRFATPTGRPLTPPDGQSCKTAIAWGDEHEAALP